MKLPAVASMALLAACGHPRLQPLAEIATGTAPHVVSPRDADALARCIAGNANALSEGAIVRQRTHKDGSHEVIVTAGRDAVNRIAFARVKAASRGATAVISVPDPTLGPATVRERLLKDC